MKKINKLLFGILLLFGLTISVHASSGKISVSGPSQVLVGNTFEVKVTLSSSTNIGTWEFSVNYDSGKFKLVSGNKSVKDYGPKTSKTYTYKFKAIGTGSGKISIGNALLLDYNTEDKMSVSTGSKTIKVITKEQQQASYSKDNYLKSLSIDGLKISPSFKKDTLEYTAEAGSNTTSINIKATANDSRSSVSGKGKHDVGEGANVFKIVVKAQNGSTRTYKVTVNVVDPNPIVVNIDGKDLTVVKRESVLVSPEGYEKTTIKINDIDVPAFYNETNKYTLVGLRNEEETNLYIYNQETNTYNKYYEIKLEELNIYPLEIEKDFGSNFTKDNIVINETTFPSLKLNNSDYHIIYARNLETGENNYYLYDSETNTAIKYKEEEKQIDNTLNEKEDKNDYKNMVILLTGACAIMMFTTLFALVSKNKSKNELRKLLKMIKDKQEESERIKKEKEIKESEEVVKEEGSSVKPKKEKKKSNKNKVNK